MDKKKPNSHLALSGKTLLANKSLDGSYFEKTVIFIFSHDEDGALGVIINKHEKTYNQKQILENFPILKEVVSKETTIDVFTGGPLEENQHYVLFPDKSILDTTNNITLFENTDMFLRDNIIMESNDNFFIVKGFCSWAPLQLEDEVKSGDWLVTKIESEQIFNTKEKKHLWNKLIKKLGISNFKNLVSYTGNA